MERNLIKVFWNCGDNDIVEYAIMRSRLNRREKQVLNMMFDECMTQEQVAEKLDTSTRQIQYIFKSATTKLLGLPWVAAYSSSMLKEQG